MTVKIYCIHDQILSCIKLTSEQINVLGVRKKSFRVSPKGVSSGSLTAQWLLKHISGCSNESLSKENSCTLKPVTVLTTDKFPPSLCLPHSLCLPQPLCLLQATKVNGLLIRLVFYHVGVLPSSSKSVFGVIWGLRNL